ncbi:hypothetical protein A0H81_13115 [Grifola frondosa]|uniref:Uncharacterized protein n=1 Tax=Grifola frondosa TaxID=5627 RepID=A0A1C7LQ64_GRIFR|nr:hypothetical protein A0H81_13115 [Grifola frondosa]
MAGCRAGVLTLSRAKRNIWVRWKKKVHGTWKCERVESGATPHPSWTIAPRENSGGKIAKFADHCGRRKLLTRRAFEYLENF